MILALKDIKTETLQLLNEDGCLTNLQIELHEAAYRCPDIEIQKIGEVDLRSMTSTFQYQKGSLLSDIEKLKEYCSLAAALPPNGFIALRRTNSREITYLAISSIKGVYREEGAVSSEYRNYVELNSGNIWHVHDTVKQVLLLITQAQRKED